MIGKTNIVSGDGDLNITNGIINQYLAETQDINPNTFVQFVDSLDITTTTTTNTVSYWWKAVKTAENEVVLAVAGAGLKLYTYRLQNNAITYVSSLDKSVETSGSVTYGDVIFDGNYLHVGYVKSSVIYYRRCHVGSTSMSSILQVVSSSTSHIRMCFVRGTGYILMTYGAKLAYIKTGSTQSVLQTNVTLPKRNDGFV